MKTQGLRRALRGLYTDMCFLLDEPAHYAGHQGLSIDQARQDLAGYQLDLEEAISGIKEARKRLIFFYARLLTSLRDDDWKRSWLEEEGEALDVWLCLEMVLKEGGLGKLLAKRGQRAYLAPKELRDFLSQAGYVQAYRQDTSRLQRLLACLVYAQENGQDVLDSLQYADIEEIGAIRKDYVYVVDRGQKVRLLGLSFPDNEALYRAQKKGTSLARPQFDYKRPALSVDKKSGTRVSVAGYLATPDQAALYYNERIFRLKKITLEGLRDDYRTIDEGLYRLLCLNQKTKGSFLVTGGEMGIGKTTFLQALIEKIPDYWGIGILDTENELAAQTHYPTKNIITLVESPRLSIDQGFRYLLKTARDVMVVGEITKKEEVENLVQGAIRLNAGIGGTLHAASAGLGIDCCAQLLAGRQDPHILQKNLAQSLDLIIQLMRHPQDADRILVEELVEVVGRQVNYDDMSLEELCREDYLRRLDPRPYRLRRLAYYDLDQEAFVYLKAPSKGYLAERARYLGQGEVDDFLLFWQSLCS